MARLASGRRASRRRAQCHIGHKPPGIDAIYNVHDYAKEKRTALDRWAKHVQRVAVAEPAKVIQMPGLVAR